MEYTSNSDKITRDYFDSLLLESRYIDSCLPSTKLELYGKTFDTPIMTAALSHLGNTAKNGMEIYAEAAAKSNAVHWVGMGSDEELEKELSTGREERIQRLEAVIDELPADERMLLTLYYYEDRPLTEIAYITGIDAKALANRLYRTRKKLFKKLKD